MDAIDGLSDHFDFKKHPSQNILFGQKNNFSPTVADNLVVTYSKTLENFDFNLVLKNEKQLFEAIDAFSNLKIPTKLDVYEAKNPYHVPATLLSYLPMILMTVVIYGPIYCWFCWLVLGCVLFIESLKNRDCKYKTDEI